MGDEADKARVMEKSLQGRVATWGGCLGETVEAGGDIYPVQGLAHSVGVGEQGLWVLPAPEELLVNFNMNGGDPMAVVVAMMAAVFVLRLMWALKALLLL